jgi:poly(3-hydroxybutyrate) depolymerase
MRPQDASAGAVARAPAESTASSCQFSGSLVAGGAHNRVRVLNTAGGMREFFLVLPDGYDAPGAPPLPLLIALHGGPGLFLPFGNSFMQGARGASHAGN